MKSWRYLCKKKKKKRYFTLMDFSIDKLPFKTDGWCRRPTDVYYSVKVY